MTLYALTSEYPPKSGHSTLMFDLRDGIIPPMNLITVKACDEAHAVRKLQDIDFCNAIGLGDWLFETYALKPLS